MALEGTGGEAAALARVAEAVASLDEGERAAAVRLIEALADALAR